MRLVIGLHHQLCFGEVQHLFLMLGDVEHKRCTSWTDECVSENISVTPRVGHGGHVRCKTLNVYWGWRWMATTL